MRRHEYRVEAGGCDEKRDRDTRNETSSEAAHALGEHRQREDVRKRTHPEGEHDQRAASALATAVSSTP